MAGVMAALVTGCFAVLVAMLQRGRKQNSREHADTVHRIDRVLHGLGRLDAKLDRHLSDHEDGTT
jgi:hypothetical protein